MGQLEMKNENKEALNFTKPKEMKKEPLQNSAHDPGCTPAIETIQ